MATHVERVSYWWSLFHRAKEIECKNLRLSVHRQTKRWELETCGNDKTFVFTKSENLEWVSFDSKFEFRRREDTEKLGSWKFSSWLHQLEIKLPD